MVEPYLKTRKRKCLKNSEVRRDRNVWGPTSHISWNMGPRLQLTLPILLLMSWFADFCLLSACFPAWLVHHVLLSGLQSLHLCVPSSNKKTPTPKKASHHTHKKTVVFTLLNSCICCLVILQASTHQNFPMPLHFDSSLNKFAIAIELNLDIFFKTTSLDLAVTWAECKPLLLLIIKINWSVDFLKKVNHKPTSC